MDKIELVPIEYLRHHPDNPRKDLGDLKELADSIKANGIHQNLTVVTADTDRLSKEDKKSGFHLFWVVIGNRRLEAAKMAGLKELPCALSEMDYKTQVATMLEENMQRQDLTIYEQAEGFQMMMDLGYTEKQIGEKTGFSTKTVKDRLKLTKLDKKGFGKAVNQGATLVDLIEITKLDSEKDQAEVLKVAGTENFRQQMNIKLKNQAVAKNKERLMPVIKELMTEIPKDEQYSSKWERMWNESFDMAESEEELRKHVEKIKKKFPDVPWRYRLNDYGKEGEIEFYHGKPKVQETEEEKARKLEERKKKAHLNAVKEIHRQAFELRSEFIRNYAVGLGPGTTIMIKRLLEIGCRDVTSWSGEVNRHSPEDRIVRNLLGLDKPVKKKDGTWKSLWEEAEEKSIPTAKLLLAYAVGGGMFWPDSAEHGWYDPYSGKYQKDSAKNNGIDELYRFLEGIGYQMSDMEKQLQDGTHECYKEDADEDSGD